MKIHHILNGIAAFTSHPLQILACAASAACAACFSVCQMHEYHLTFINGFKCYGNKVSNHIMDNKRIGIGSM
jgi:hypothetical protein